jgi:hypothetical protein
MAGAFRREPDVFNRLRPAAIEPVEKFSNPKPELNEAPVTDRETKRVRFFSASPQLKGVGERLKNSHNFTCMQP